VIDAYHDLADSLAAAASHASSQAPRARLEALAHAYRSWALAQLHRYRLLFGLPLPGYNAHAERLVAAAAEAMSLLFGILGGPAHPTAAPLPQPLAGQLVAWAQPYASGIDPASALRAVLIWSRLHGIVSSKSPVTSPRWASTLVSSSRPSWRRCRSAAVPKTEPRWYQPAAG
jgi:hypothetical protein